MQRPRVQSTAGWAAFDRLHRPESQKMDSFTSDPFPPISGSSHVGSSSSLTKANSSTMKSFSSVVRPCNRLEDSVKMLKDANPWADQSLIEDVLQGVNNDFTMACQVLKSMVLNLVAGETTISEEKGSSDGKKNKDLIEAARPYEHSIISDGMGSTSDENNIHLHGNNDGFTSSVPIEPEWEPDDDVYFDHRKEALKFMRAASHHSRAASNAFQHGDHFSARELSKQAQKEWVEAEKLNANAAKQILKLKNMNNDLWKLDLHGLHASEAIQALEECLSKIECDMLKTGPTWKDSMITRPRQNILHVITGIGTHSKGYASLPAAVKGFLIENRYRFEEARPGVISVHPKFRYKNQMRLGDSRGCESSL